MTKTYHVIGQLSVLTGAICFGLIFLSALGYVGGLRLGGFSFWPLVMLTLIASLFVASWAFAKAKGRSGWLGLLVPFLDVFGLKILFKPKDRDRRRYEA